MALIRNYEVPGTGYTIENAYHVIGDIRLDKRTHSIPVGQNSLDPLNGNPGYSALIFIHVFASKQSRDDQMKPIGFINNAIPEINIPLKFSYIPENLDNILTQAYNHLKTTEYYQNSLED